MDEFTFIERLKKKIPPAKNAVLGIGDDAAVLRFSGPGRLVVSTDMIVEKVDFVLNRSEPEQIGRKALAVNLSDLAAMGAKPLAFVISIGKPAYVDARWLDRFYDGLLRLARRYKVDCVGGDFSAAKEFSASVTIFGTARKPIFRSGAKAGDWIAVTGRLGGSILRHHFDFTPRVREGLALARSGLVHSMIDISDGLCQDLHHILNASCVAAELDPRRIPVSSDAIHLGRKNSLAALERALTDGEDFELLFTVPGPAKSVLERRWKKECRGVSLNWIGRIVKGKPGIRWISNDKRVRMRRGLSRKGFRHF
jgi:thiamine-monophosphate kinase